MTNPVPLPIVAYLVQWHHEDAPVNSLHFSKPLAEQAIGDGCAWAELIPLCNLSDADARVAQATQPLLEEIESIKTFVKKLAKSLETTLLENEQLRAHIEQMQKDADRWKFWRENIIEYKPSQYDGQPFGRFDIVWRCETDDVDAETDAAILKQLTKEKP